MSITAASNDRAERILDDLALRVDAGIARVVHEDVQGEDVQRLLTHLDGPPSERSLIADLGPIPERKRVAHE